MDAVESSRRGSPSDLDERLLRFRARPDVADAPGLAAALVDAGRATEALEVIDGAHALGGADPHLLVLAGRAWLVEGELLRAQQLLLKAARGMPRDPAPLRWLGEVLLKRGDPDRAAKVLAKAAQLVPGDAQVQKLRERAERLARVAASAEHEDPSSPPGSEEPARAPEQGGPPSPPKPAVPAPPKPAARTKPAVPSPPKPAVPSPVVPDFELDDDEATRVADAGGHAAPAMDFETDESTVVASDISEELAHSTRGQAEPASGHPSPPPPAPPRPQMPPPPPVLEDPDADAGGWTSAADEPTAFTDMDELRPSSAHPAPPSPAAPAPAAPPSAQAAPQGTDEAQRLVDTLDRRGLLESPEGEPLEWASRKEARRPGTRVGWTMLGLWVLVLGLAVGGYYGYLHWNDLRAQQADDAVERAHALALDGDHASLQEAERALRGAREKDPTNAQVPAVLLAVELQRAFEEGAMEPAALRRALTRAERSGAAEALVEVARATLHVADGKPEEARRALADPPPASSDPWLQYAAGRLWLRLGDEEAGVSALERALEAEPRLHAAHLALAEAHADAGRVEDALRAVEQVRDRAPDHLRATLWWAWLAAASEDPATLGATLEALESRVHEAAAADRALWHLARSRVLERQGDDTGAADAARRAARSQVAAPRWLARVADRAAEVGRWALAEQVASLAVQNGPHLDAHRERLARILVLRRDGVGALRTLASLSEQDPQVLALSARAALLAGAPDAVREASEALGAHLKEADEPAPVLQALHLRTRLALGDERGLLAEARRLRRRAPEEPEIARTVAEVALAARRPDTAIEALEPAVERRPEDPDAHFLLGRAHRMKGDGEAARQALEHAVALSPQHFEARMALGYLLLDQGRYEQAAELYRVLMDRGREHEALVGRLGRAEALAATGEVEPAVELLEAVPEAQRDTPAYRVAAARVAVARRKGGEAVKYLQPLAAAEDASADLIALYGDALYAAGDVNAAHDQYERAIAQDASHPEALVGRGRVMVRANKPKKALELLDEAERALESRIRPPALRARLLTYRGRAMLARGDRGGARQALRDATAIEAAPAEAYFFLGEALAGAHARQAREAYGAYLEREPKGPYALRAKRALN